MLSTHYMEEAVELGDRIGIMVDGKLIASGTMSELNERHCRSFNVEVVLGMNAPSGTTDRILAGLKKDVGVEPVVTENYGLRFKLEIPFTNNGSRTAQLGRLFEHFTAEKDDLYIQFFTVNVASLEQIFIDL